MNIIIPINQAERKILMSKLREVATPLVTVVVCLLLLIAVIIPQVQSYIDVRSQTEAKRKRIAVLKSNVNLLAGYTESDVDNKFQLVAQALPTEKNVLGIIHTISNAASISNVALADYSFQVGKITSDTKGSSSLQVRLLLNGTADRIASFLNVLQTTFPLSEVLNISIDESGASTITIVFYYESVPKITLKDEDPINPLSQHDQEVLQTLSSWNTAQQ